jgi:hypothetical protein
MILIGHPIDNDAELLSSLPVSNDHEVLADGKIENADQVPRGKWD